jgi:hypothetical protein
MVGMNEQQLHADMLRAAKARELLDNSVLAEALDLIERDTVRLWGLCPARDHEGKEHLWRLYKTAQQFRLVLLEFIATGEYAEAKLKAGAQSRTILDRVRGAIGA